MRNLLIASTCLLLVACAGQSRLGGAVMANAADEITLCQIAYHGETMGEKQMAYQELVYRSVEPQSNECERHAAQTMFGGSVPRLVGDSGFLERVKGIKPDTVESTDQYGEEIDLLEILF